jgi:hypothetical protein
MRWSWIAGSITALYVVIAGYVTVDEVRNTSGGWINLRGMGTWIVTAPSQAILGNLLRAFGIAKVNYADLRAADYLELIAHVLLSALFIYLLSLGVELLVRRLFSPS